MSKFQLKNFFKSFLWNNPCFFTVLYY